MVVGNKKLLVTHRRVYTPEPFLQHPLLLLRSIALDLCSGRDLAWRLFVRDLAAAYRQTALGYMWVFLPPFVAAGTFIFLQSQGITNIKGTSIPFPAFALVGTLLWQIFADSLVCPIQSLGRAKPMLAKINFPREAVLLSGLYMVLFSAAVRLLLVIMVIVVWKIPISATVLFFPVAVVALIAAGLSIGLLLAPAGALYGDVASALAIGSGLWMLLTPVVYPPQTQGLAGWLATWNPISPLIITARETLTGQSLTQLEPFFIVFCASLLLLLLGLIGFRIAMPHMIARMGS